MIKILMQIMLFSPLQCWRCILVPVLYLLISLLQLVFTSHLLGVVPFSDVLLLGSFILEQAPLYPLRGRLSHHILRVLYRSNLQPWDLSSCLHGPPSPVSRWSGRSALFWRVKSSGSATGAWERVSDEWREWRLPALPSSSTWCPPNLMSGLPLTHSVGKLARCMSKASGSAECLFFNNSSAHTPYPCARGL